MRILITGGCGYKGSVLINQLLNDGYEIKNIDNQWFGNYLSPHPRLENIKKILQIENFTNCGENLVKDFFDLEYKKIILKRPLKFRKNYSNINYQVLGKTTRFDIYL